jgi:hypothetical protein
MKKKLIATPQDIQERLSTYLVLHPQDYLEVENVVKALRGGIERVSTALPSTSVLCQRLDQ